jgi:hypothetical protein
LEGKVVIEISLGWDWEREKFISQGTLPPKGPRIIQQFPVKQEARCTLSTHSP